MSNETAPAEYDEAADALTALAVVAGVEMGWLVDRYDPLRFVLGAAVEDAGQHEWHRWEERGSVAPVCKPRVRLSSFGWIPYGSRDVLLAEPKPEVLPYIHSPLDFANSAAGAYEDTADE